MEVSLLLAAVLSGITLWLLVAPLVLGHSEKFDLTPTGLRGAALIQEEKRRVELEALRDLEFEYETGKIDEDDYQTLRAEYTLRIASNLPGAPASSPGQDDSDLEEVIRRKRESLS